VGRPAVLQRRHLHCKAFSADAAVRFTEKWFAASEIVHKEF
jgi:hypothetical protein